jgi:hypothetical protein
MRSELDHHRVPYRTGYLADMSFYRLLITSRLAADGPLLPSWCVTVTRLCRTAQLQNRLEIGADPRSDSCRKHWDAQSCTTPPPAPITPSLECFFLSYHYLTLIDLSGTVHAITGRIRRKAATTSGMPPQEALCCRMFQLAPTSPELAGYTRDSAYLAPHWANGEIAIAMGAIKKHDGDGLLRGS